MTTITITITITVTETITIAVAVVITITITITITKIAIDNGTRTNYVASNSVCNHTSDSQNRWVLIVIDFRLITSMSTDQIEQHDGVTK